MDDPSTTRMAYCGIHCGIRPFQTFSDHATSTHPGAGRVKAGSIELLGTGHIRLTEAAALLGTTPQALAEQLHHRHARIYGSTCRPSTGTAGRSPTWTTPATVSMTTWGA